MLSASTLSAALLLLPRSSPNGVGTGVAVGLGVELGLGVGLTPYAVGESPKQTSATAMRVRADAKLREDFASRCFRTRRTEVWIGVFIGLLLCIWFLVSGNVVVRHLFPEFRDEVPENFRHDCFLKRV